MGIILKMMLYGFIYFLFKGNQVGIVNVKRYFF